MHIVTSACSGMPLLIILLGTSSLQQQPVVLDCWFSAQHSTGIPDFNASCSFNENYESTDDSDAKML